MRDMTNIFSHMRTSNVKEAVGEKCFCIASETSLICLLETSKG